jgi:hypothetical protein
MSAAAEYLSATDFLTRRPSGLVVAEAHIETMYSVVVALSDGSRYRLYPVEDCWKNLPGKRIWDCVESSRGQFSFLRIIFTSHDDANFRI